MGITSSRAASHDIQESPLNVNHTVANDLHSTTTNTLIISDTSRDNNCSSKVGNNNTNGGVVAPHPRLLFALDLQRVLPKPEQWYWPMHVWSFAVATFFANGFWVGTTRRFTQFLAENAHRAPRTRAGWYLYQRTKNQEALLSGVSKGFHMARGSLLVANFLILEQLVATFGTYGEFTPIGSLAASTTSMLLAARRIGLDAAYLARALKVTTAVTLVYSGGIACATYFNGESPRLPNVPVDHSVYVPYSLGPDPAAMKTLSTMYDTITRPLTIAWKPNVLSKYDNINLPVPLPNGFILPVSHPGSSIAQAPQTS